MLSHNLLPKLFADTFGKIRETSDIGGFVENFTTSIINF